MHYLDREQALAFVSERSDLFDLAGRENPFACSAWLLHFIEQIVDDDWTVVVPEHIGDGRSLMLLYTDMDSPTRRSALNNYYSSLYSPLISSAADRQAALAALVLQLVRRRPRPSAITFSPLDDSAPDTAALQRIFSDQGWYVRRYACFGNWYLPCADLSFDRYLCGRSRQVQNTWMRKSRKFRQHPDARLEIVTGREEVAAAMDAYDAIYANSWKRPEPYPNFVRGWATICAERGWLRLGLAWLGHVPIAAQFWFTMNRRAHIFKLAYDEKYAEWSAGTVLTGRMIEMSLEKDWVVEIDYLTGDDSYKRSWMTHRRQRIGLLACNPWNARGLAMTAREYAGELRQRWRERAARQDPVLSSLSTDQAEP